MSRGTQVPDWVKIQPPLTVAYLRKSTISVRPTTNEPSIARPHLKLADLVINSAYAPNAQVMPAPQHHLPGAEGVRTALLAHKIGSHVGKSLVDLATRSFVEQRKRVIYLHR